MLLRISLVLVMVQEHSSCFCFGRHQPLINRQARIAESPSISLEHCVVIRFNPSPPNCGIPIVWVINPALPPTSGSHSHCIESLNEVVSITAVPVGSVSKAINGHSFP